MKTCKFLLIFVLLVLVNHFINCQIIKTIEDLELKGPIKKVVEKHFNASINMGDVEATELINKSTYEFYENGNIKNHIFNPNFGEINDNIILNKYSNDGKLLSTYSRFYSENFYIKDTFIYNNFNQIQKILRIDKAMEYESDRMETMEGSYNFIYSNSNNLIQIIKNGYIQDLPCYNCEDILLSNLERKNELLNTFIDETKKIEDLIYNSRTNIYYKYEYNIQNNWIKCIVFVDDKPVLIKTREITYF